MRYVLFLLNYTQKYRSIHLFTCKTTRLVLRFIALILFIFFFMLMPTLSVFGLVLFYSIFWTQGIFEYSLYLLWVNTVLAWIKLILLFIFTILFGKFFWYTWVYWMFTHFTSICVDICIYVDALDAYIRVLEHNLKREQFIKEKLKNIDFSKFRNTSKDRKKKRKLEREYLLYNPYDVDVYQVVPKGSYDFLNNYIVHKEDFYYKYYRPELNITFQTFFKKTLKFITNDKIPDFLVDVLFFFFCFLLPKPVKEKLQYRGLIHLYLYSWTNGFSKIIDLIFFCILLYPFSFFYFRL